MLFEITIEVETPLLIIVKESCLVSVTMFFKKEKKTLLHGKDGWNRIITQLIYYLSKNYFKRKHWRKVIFLEILAVSPYPTA